MGQYDAKLMKIYDKRTTLPHLLYQKRAEKRRYAISHPQVIGIIRYHIGTHVHYHSGARKDIHQARSSPSRRAQKQFWNRPFLSILIQYSFNIVQSFSISALFPSKSLHYPNKCLTFAAPEPAKPLNDAQIVRVVFFINFADDSERLYLCGIGNKRINK